MLHPMYSHILLPVPSQQRQVEDEREPIPVDEKQKGQECVYGGFGDDIGVEAVAEVDRVDVVTGAKIRKASNRSGARRAARISGANIICCPFVQRTTLTIPSRYTLW